MEIAFEILVPPRTELEFKLTRKLFEWQGHLYPQGFPEYWFGRHFQLIETPSPTHLNLILPGDISKMSWRCLSVKGDGLEILRNSDANVQWDGKGLGDLLKTLLSGVSQWVIVFEIDYDKIERTFYCVPEDVERLILISLTTKIGGFVALSQNMKKRV